MVEQPSWWNWHLASFNIFPAGRMPTPLIFIQRFSNAEKAKSKEGFKRCIPYSLLPTPYSLLPTPCAIDSMKKNTMAVGHATRTEENYGNRDAP
ncbi:hypothetical protein [Moorena sp. SIO3I6]|uniref:hypothetical protein n=1 Tax=Moorena sp. SIO3I6 TaxID=2607831 RepID=UPI0013FAC718|nr:hypothetical protein [Moorena sp. SIO3I6]NEP28649.1 hypothetical protein [Moorena sp. SIO3I6]